MLSVLEAKIFQYSLRKKPLLILNLEKWSHFYGHNFEPWDGYENTMPGLGLHAAL